MTRWLPTLYRLAVVAVMGNAALFSTGCANRPKPAATGDVTIFVPGVAGDGAWYDGLIDEITRATNRPPVVLEWGLVGPLVFANFSDANVHNAAEKKLAGVIEARLATDPSARLSLLGHSAGGGVVLGALARLPERLSVDHVTLLAPSVSPGYNLSPAFAHSRQGVDVFVSRRDTLFLQWRCRTFGTYDRVRTEAAGFAGFTIDPSETRVRHHDWTPDDERIGNDGGHFGATAAQFVALRVMTLTQGQIASTDDSQSPPPAGADLGTLAPAYDFSSLREVLSARSREKNSDPHPGLSDNEASTVPALDSRPDRADTD